MSSLAAATDLLHLFGDATRVRLVALLEHEELTVAELTRITELPQSRISTHLGKLRDGGILRDRKQGASTFYSMNGGAMPTDARRLWSLLSSDLDEPVLRADRARAEALVRARGQDESWPDSVAGRMERYYSPGRTWEATARGFLGFLRLGDVLDAGSGDGTIAELLAPRARSVTCLDRSQKVLEAARDRLRGLTNVKFAEGDLHALPFPASHFDQALLFNVLVYAANPAHVIGDAARVLRPGGDLVIITLAQHDQHSVTAPYGHIHDGFSPQGLHGWLGEAGMIVDRCDVTSRERREPHFLVVTAFARKRGLRQAGRKSAQR